MPDQRDEMHYFALSLVPILNRLDSRCQAEAKIIIVDVLYEVVFKDSE